MFYVLLVSMRQMHYTGKPISSLLHVTRYKRGLTRFNKNAIQGTPQIVVDKEDRAYRESTHVLILSVPCSYTKCNLP